MDLIFGREFVRFCRSLAAILLPVVMAACRVEVFVPEGGRVETRSGSFSCASGETCELGVTDLFFDETFIAVAEEGYRFQHWQSHHRHLCGGNAGACQLSTETFDGNAVLENILASDELFYLQPRFRSDAAAASHRLTQRLTSIRELHNDL